MKKLIDKIADTKTFTRSELLDILSCDEEYLFERARAAREKVYGKKVFIRGLIELTNYCKNDCYYCGIRHSNHNCERYRMGKDEILDCCRKGYALGLRTFVLQGGEDSYYTDDILEKIIKEINETYADCAITLSLGERSYDSYKRLFDAGADRYLLRHETANAEHYKTLHPPELSLANRKQCLWDLKKIGYQVGCGFMVGSPGQKLEHIAEDIEFIMQLNPHMVGLGPFLPHSATPYANEKAGDMRLTRSCLAILRLLRPNLLLPATTALVTLADDGREQGILAGANVVMPNISPINVREKYLLYDNKKHTGLEAAEGVERLKNRLKDIGYEIVVSRGDYIAQ